MKKLILALVIGLIFTANPAFALFPPATPGFTRTSDPSDIEGYTQTQVVTSTTAAEVVLPEGIYAVWANTTDAFIKVVPTTGTGTDVTATNGFVIRAGGAITRLFIRGGRKVGYVSTGAGTLSFQKVN